VSIWDGRARSSTKPVQSLQDAKDSVTSVHVVQAGGGDPSQSSSALPNLATGGATALIRTSSVDGVIRTYDVRRGLLQCDNCGSPITSMARTRDGQCLAISCLDGTIRLMELETGELLNTYHGHHTAGQYGLEVAILANDATIVTGSEDGCCVLYDLVRATRTQCLLPHESSASCGTGRPHPLCSIAAHPTKSSVVLTASYDGTNVVWADDPSLWSHQLLSSKE
jgi:mitogen-activated protein kinase organizer 1